MCGIVLGLSFWRSFKKNETAGGSAKPVLSAFPADEWYSGAEDYLRLRDLAAEHKLPLIVYFYTDGSGYSRRFDRAYLWDPSTAKALSEFHRVRLNPERSEGELKIKEEFQVGGYPCFLVTMPSRGLAAVKVHPFHASGQVPTGKFVDDVKEAVAKLLAGP